MLVPKQVKWLFQAVVLSLPLIALTLTGRLALAADGPTAASSSSEPDAPNNNNEPFTPTVTPVNVAPSQVIPDVMSATTAQQLPQGFTPQVPGSISAGAVQTTSGIIGYRPISESMLPATAASATQVTGQPAPSVGQSLLGGPAFTMGPYTLGKDDVIQIIVRGQPEFSGTFAVGHSGAIQYGYVGDIVADGLTKEELRQVLTEKLKQYVRVPAVQVAIVGFNSKAIYVLGQVARPGKYAMRGDTIKIRDAVIAAGLVIKHAAMRRVHIIKSDPNDPSYRVIDLYDVLLKGKMKQNVDLVNGDIIVVPTTFFGKVTGFIADLVDPASHAGAVAALAAI